MIPEKELKLSIIDQTICRVYLRHLLVFPFPDSSLASDAVRAIFTGLTRTLRDYPILAGTLEVSDRRMGLIKAVYPGSTCPADRHDLFSVNDALGRDIVFDYNVMKAKGFPPALLPGHVFCPTGLRNRPGLDDPYAEKAAGAANGHPIPVMSTSATFIPGGLVLSMYIHHTIVDGTSLNKVYETWSGPLLNLDARDKYLQSRNLDAMRLGASLGAIPDCPELTTLSTKQNRDPLRRTPYNVVSKVLIFSASHIAALRKEVQALTSVRVSTFTTITTLVWSHITRARSHALQSGGHTTTTLGIAIDMRNRVKDPAAKEYMGNMALWTNATVDVPESSRTLNVQQRATHLLPFALAINEAVSSIDSTWFEKRLHYLANIRDPTNVTPNLTTSNGPDLFITSWQHLGADCEWDIPGTTDAKASTIRKPNHIAEGGLIVLPCREDGNRPYEIALGLEEEDMSRLVDELGEMLEGVLDG